MDIIRYKPNCYTSNIALLVTANKILAGNKLYNAEDDINSMLAVAKDNLLNSYDGIDTSLYDIYTIDLLGYRELFMLYGNYLYSIFDKWQKLLQSLLSNDMSNTLYTNVNNVADNDYCDMTVLSIEQRAFINTQLKRELALKGLFKRTNVASTRLINIAIPKSMNVAKFYAKCQLITKNDGSHKSMQVCMHNQQTYDLSDYNFVQQSIGYAVYIRKQEHTIVSIAVSSLSTSNKVLCKDLPIEQMQQLEQYCTCTDTGNYWKLQFAYNSNRTYIVTSNSTKYTESQIDAGSILVTSTDMLTHALATNMLYANKYISTNATWPTSFTLPAAYSEILCYEVKPVTWHTNDYDYGNYSMQSSLAWTGFSYKYVPVQTNDAQYVSKWFMKNDMSIDYGNLHTFALQSTYMKHFAYNDLHTTCPLLADEQVPNANLDLAFSKITLPAIYNGKVTFRNITYGFHDKNGSTKYFDGKKFCLVLKHTVTETPFSELLWSSNYCCIVINVDLTNVLLNASKISIDDLTIEDFYRTNAIELNPAALAYFASSAFGAYTIYADSTCSEICMQLPVSAL